MRLYPFDFGVCIARPEQATLFDLSELAQRTDRVFVDGTDETPPLKWQGSRASWGCALSHRAAILKAIEANAERAVIFEFDAEPGHPLPDIANVIRATLDRLDERDPHWGALYLGGYFPRGSKQIPLGGGLIQTDAVMLAHAYALSAVGLQAAAQICDRAVSGHSLWPYGHIDVAFSTTLHSLCSIYAVEPWRFGQSEHISELTGKLCQRPVATTVLDCADLSRKSGESPDKCGCRRRDVRRLA